MIAALVAGLAAAVVVGSPPARHLRRLEVLEVASRRRWPRRLPLAGLALVVTALVGGARLVLWALTAGVIAATAGWLVTRHRRRRREAQAAEECARATRILASLLRSGQIPTIALAEAASDCPVLEPAAAASRMGADVAASLRRLAAVPGQGGLGAVAAAWAVSERSGAPIATVLARVADNLRRQRQLQAVIDGELAAARASGNIMAALPFLAVGLGFAVGVNPVAFLTRNVLGQVLILVGVSLTAAGVLWIDRLAAARQP